MSTLDELRWVKFPVLDRGFVALVDAMGDDAAVCQAARVSYGAGTRPVSDDRTLIRYLMRHRHATPFEMAEVKLLVRAPMDVTRQWWRHRTASINEASTRYSVAIDEAQATPADGWRAQATDNKQGSAGAVEAWPDGWHVDRSGDMTFLSRPDGKGGFDPNVFGFARGQDIGPGGYLSYREQLVQHMARAVYEERLAFGVAREQARKDLPLSTYTEAYWKCDLRNVLHFLALRMDPHAQAEIRQYATVIGREIVAKLFPLTWEAFEDYTLGAVTLSAPDVAAIRAVVAGADPLAHLENRREREECRAKLVRLGLIENVETSRSTSS